MMIDTLLELLKVDVAAPEILLEEDGCICLDYGVSFSISIWPSGAVSWASLDKGHGTNLNEFIELVSQWDNLT